MMIILITIQRELRGTPNLPTNIIPTNIAWLKLSGKFAMDMRIPPLSIKIMFESNPLKSTMLVGRLGVLSTSLHVQRLMVDRCSNPLPWDPLN